MMDKTVIQWLPLSNCSGIITFVWAAILFPVHPYIKSATALTSTRTKTLKKESGVGMLLTGKQSTAQENISHFYHGQSKT